jgi:hypothetical protein
MKSPPLGLDPAFGLQPVQRRIKRAVIDQKNVFRLLLNGPRDSLAVIRAKHQHAENKHVQRSLQQRGAVFVFSG